MRVSDFAGDLYLPLLKDSHLWEREVSRITSVDLDVFIRLHADFGQHRRAFVEVDALMSACWDYCVREGMEPPNMIAFAPTPERLTIDELNASLSKLTLERRRAILFCLETSMTLEEVSTLTWKKLYSKRISKYALKIAESQARHFKLPYVFWERVTVIAMPLVGLAQDMITVSHGKGHIWLRSQYMDLVPISYESDFDEITKLFEIQE
ncbi:hypothetical protein [Methyloversatilis sp.]|uniref:hypothetical protein n=1 Tax=Methyloversatilis sp. TaxID=2569862 RepID=UPI0035B2A7C6